MVGPRGESLGTAGSYAAATLNALAREEALGRKGRRLTETRRATWSRFRGRLTDRDLLEILLEDAAVTQPHPFAHRPDGVDLQDLPEEEIAGWMAELATTPVDAESADYIAAQAKILGLPTRMAKADIPRIKAHHRVLELPGSGGQLAHHVTGQEESLHLPSVFTIACADWRDRTLAGIVAVERGIAGDVNIVVDPSLESLRGKTFDHVIGLSKDKGGPFDRATLDLYFPNTTITLV